MNCSICGKKTTNIITNRLRGGQAGTVYYCPDCDYAMLKSSFESIEEYYNNEYRKNFKDNLQGIEPTADEIYKTRCDFQMDRLEIIESYYSVEKTFLEIGCSAGQFLSKIKGKFKEVVGVELAKNCADYVREVFQIPVYTQTFQEICWENKFDYIGFFQVLEHIDQPDIFLQSIAKVLNEDGRVFIEVPNLNDPLRKLYDLSGYEEFFYHEAHLSYFTEKSIALLLEKNGFEVEKIHFLQDYNFLNHIYWYFNNKPQPTCEFGLSDPYLQFKTESLKIKNAGEEINQLLVETNNQYISILKKYGLTSNLFIVAKKANAD